MLNSWTISSETFTFSSLPLLQDVFVPFARKHTSLIHDFICLKSRIYTGIAICSSVVRFLRLQWVQPLWRTWCWRTWYVHVNTVGNVHVNTVGNVQVITNNYAFCTLFLEEYFSNWFPLFEKHLTLAILTVVSIKNTVSWKVLS